LESCRENYPNQIREVHQRNPFCMGIYCHHRPNERSEDEQNINRGEQIILQPELNGRESEVENYIYHKRQKDEKRNAALPKHIAGRTERDDDNYIKNRPHRAEQPRRRRPGGFCEILIPGLSVHFRYFLFLSYLKTRFFSRKNIVI
jgi:hypothetical protein